ncbi:MAG: hypothetical protein P8Y24_14235 [Gammaproteobacteria bacterium]
MTHSVVESPINDVTDKRRAVYTSLFPYFSSEALINAMWLWEENYASGHGSSLRQFVAEITQGTENKQNSKKIYNAIMMNFLKPVSSYKTDPIDMMLAYRAGKIKFDDESLNPVLMKIPENIIFNFVMENLHGVASKENPYLASKTLEYFSTNIFNLRLDIHKTKEILQWSEDQSIFIGRNYSAGYFHEYCH